VTGPAALDRESRSNVVLVIDDDPLPRMVAEALLRAEGYTVITADEGLAGVKLAREARPDLVLLDVVMPGLNGFGVCEKLRQTPEVADVPIVMVTTLDDRASRIRGLECGADDFLSKPLDPSELRARVRTIMRLNRYRRMATLTADLAAAYDATLEGWVRALDMRDHETEGHTLRVTTMTMKLAEAIGVPEEDLDHVRRGALLHDIGKIGVPDAILHKPGRLDPSERLIIQQHTVWAHQMLAPIPFLQRAIDIPYCHHERWDGRGYPRGLSSTDIPLSARVFTVVDVWDALRSERPYKPAYSPETARAILSEDAGAHFDPMVADLFLEFESAGLLDPARETADMAACGGADRAVSRTGADGCT
jgi:putative two-component system response regulator